MNQAEFARLIALENGALRSVLITVLGEPVRNATEHGATEHGGNGLRAGEEGRLDIDEVRKDPERGRLWVKGHLGRDAFAATISPARVAVRVLQ